MLTLKVHCGTFDEVEFHSTRVTAKGVDSLERNQRMVATSDGLTHSNAIVSMDNIGGWPARSTIKMAVEI